MVSLGGRAPLPERKGCHPPSPFPGSLKYGSGGGRGEALAIFSWTQHLTVCGDRLGCVLAHRSIYEAHTGLLLTEALFIYSVFKIIPSAAPPRPVGPLTLSLPSGPVHGGGKGLVLALGALVPRAGLQSLRSWPCLFLSLGLHLLRDEMEEGAGQMTWKGPSWLRRGLSQKNKVSHGQSNPRSELKAGASWSQA